MHLSGHGGPKRLYLGVVLLACAAGPAQAQTTRSYMADAPAAKAFCASPEFKALQCGWASERERNLTGENQCDGLPITSGGYYSRCDPNFQMLPEKLPAKVGQHNGIRHGRALSLACKGRIVVRAVFKMLMPAPAGNKVAVRLGNHPTGTFVFEDEPPGTPHTAPSELVRCRLQLPAGAEPEEARALKAREADCFKCGEDACPAAEGAWYSDSYTSNAIGCGDFAQGYTMRFEELEFGGGDDPVLILLAKFEACGDAGCFDAAYEAAKAKGAAAAPKASG